MTPDEILRSMEDVGTIGDERILRPPFGYIGGKSKCVNEILPYLPYRHTYVEPFGGSGAVLLSRNKCKLDVFNDRYSGVTCFYRCLRDKFKQLSDRLSMSINSKEEFYYCKDTWENCEDDVERAARWFYMISNSFGNLGRNWGRETKLTHTNSLLNRLPEFAPLNKRLRDVQIDNCDWRECFRDYDSSNTVFYCDPTYLNTPEGSYKHTLSNEDHKDLLDTIFAAKGYIVLSGYENILYDKYPWDDIHIFNKFSSVAGLNNEGNFNQRSVNKELLYIKH